MGWTLGLMVTAAIIGYSLEEFSGMFAELEALQRIIGDEVNFLPNFMNVLMVQLAMVMTIFAVLVAARVRQEELTSRSGYVLSTPLQRLHWLGSFTVVGVLSTWWLLFVTGMTAGIAGAWVTGDVENFLPPLVSGALVQLPAVWLVLALAVLFVAMAPRRGHLLGWLVVTVSFVTGLMWRDMLELPEWTLYLLPFNYLPEVPAVSLQPDNVIAMSLLALVLLLLAAVVFSQRQLRHT